MATDAQNRFKERDESKAYIRQAPPRKPREADPDAEEIYKRFVDSAKLLTTPGLLNSDGRMNRAADMISGGDPGLVESAAKDAGVSVNDLLKQAERFRPGTINSFIEQKQKAPQGAPPSRFGSQEDIQTDDGKVIPASGRSTKGKGKTVVDFDSKPRPTIEDALGVMTGYGGVGLGPGAREEVDNLKAVQRQYPTGENIAREAARSRPLDSWSRAEQYMEDLDSVSDVLPFQRKTSGATLAEGEQGPKEMPVPRATYAGKGTGRPVGPGGKAQGSQEDYSAYRTQKSIDDAVAERTRQARIKFLREGGRFAADGIGTTVGGKQVSLERDPEQKVAVFPGRGKTPVDKRSGAYAYADELRDEERLAENARNKERQQNFLDSAGKPGTKLGRDREIKDIREAEAREFLTATRSRIRAAEQTSRNLKSGRVTAGSAEGIKEFYRNLDEAKATKAQLQGKDQIQQEKWARDVLDARREEQKRKEEEEKEKQRRVAAASFQDLVNNKRNNPSYLDRY